MDTTAEAVYRAMVVHRDWGVAQLAEYLEMTEEDIRAALDRLADLALVRRSLTHPTRLRPVEPQFGLFALLQSRQAQLHKSQQELAQSHATISELIVDLQSASPRVEVDQLIGIDEVQSRLEVLANHASVECLSVMPGGAQSESSIEAGLPLNEHALARGVAVRTIYLNSVRNDPGTLRYANRLTERGAEFRTAPTLPVRMLLVDREIALVPLNPDNSREGAVQITSRRIIATLLAFFEHIWNTAAPFGQEPCRAGDGLTEQERELLRLLADGLTDEVAARRLGLSLRTTRRFMADLMKRLGAKSRFEAGFRAAERGWLGSTTTLEGSRCGCPS
ncbi:LuxR C-terminal-related transcriptional regulator [Amycolatopsis sp. NPDC059657]|uniref:LuxR C-terminal-related transcriptional regulator n=1 Tax=Amycolatopsis sp. NPDC059657 TaxID=3346899 RepID=UPI00366DF95B